MDCSCYCEQPEVIWETEPVARKQHRCYECGSDIDPGEKYHKTSGIWDGEFLVFKVCMVCHRVFVKALAAADAEGCCIGFGELWETVGVEFEEAGKGAA